MTQADPQFVAPSFLTVGSGPARRRIAYRSRGGRGPAVVWMGGFRSDMASTKAEHLDQWAAAKGQAFLRFDYFAHGLSGGEFEDGTLSRWLEDSLVAIDAAGEAPVLVGSSMGGWLALLAARRLREEGRRLSGLVLIAPAVDFTEALLWPALPEAARKAVLEEGRWLAPSAYSPQPYVFTRKLFEDARQHLMLDGPPIVAGCPVHILQGMQDPDVPWRHALRLVEHLPGDDVVTTLVRDGDHRLSRPQDLERLVAAVEEMVG